MSKKKFFTTKKKLLLIGGVLFTVALVTSITTTYAWYSVLEKGYVSDLNMQISSEMNLYLGMKKDGVIDYSKTEYTEEDFGYEEDFYLHDVSGMFESRWNRNVDYDRDNPRFCSSYGTFTSHTITPYATTNDYLQLEFFLKSDIDCAVMLGKDSVFTPNVLSNEVVAREYGRDVADLNKIVDATRVSFFFEDKYVIAKNNPSSPDTYYGGLLDLNNDGYYDYDPQTLEEIVYGEYFGTPRYNDAEIDPPYTPYGPDKGVFVANHKPGVKQADLSSVTFKKENAVSLQSLIFDQETMVGKRLDPLLMLKANEEKRIVITIYLEGWDRKMTDLLNLASMDARVGFVPLFNYKA